MPDNNLNGFPDDGEHGKYAFTSEELENILREVREQAEPVPETGPSQEVVKEGTVKGEAVKTAQSGNVPAGEAAAQEKTGTAEAAAPAVRHTAKEAPAKSTVSDAAPKAAPVPAAVNSAPANRTQGTRTNAAGAAYAAGMAAKRNTPVQTGNSAVYSGGAVVRYNNSGHGLRTWHKALLVFSLVILLFSTAVFALSRILIKPPEQSATDSASRYSDTSDVSTTPSPQAGGISIKPSSSPKTDGQEDIQEAEPYTEVPKSLNSNVYNVLFAGFDAIEESIHTDTIMVLSFNEEKGTASLVSIPRDTYCNVGWTSTKKLNSAYAIGGIETLSREVGKLVGFECNYYVLVEMTAMERLVDTIGGVEYNVPYRMHYVDPVQSLYIDIYEGQQVLDGEHAVQLCRWRQNNDGYTGELNGDLGRIELQHDFIVALIKQGLSIKNVATNITNYAKIFKECVDSNLTVGEMAWFGLKLKDLGLENVNMFTLPGDAFMFGDVSYYFLYASEVAEIMDSYFNPYDGHTITTADLDIFYPTSSQISAAESYYDDYDSSDYDYWSDDGEENPDLFTTPGEDTETDDPDETNPDEGDPDVTNPDETNPDENDPNVTNPDETNPDETDQGGEGDSGTQEPNPGESDDTEPVSGDGGFFEEPTGE